MYRAIVKRIEIDGKKRIFSLKQFESLDGLDWNEAKYITYLIWRLRGKMVLPLKHLERPQLYIEDGKPLLLLCAATQLM